MRSKIKLLVVDDSAFARVTITRHFQDDSAVEVVGTARDGLDAIEKVKTLRPDVVMLDIEMPRMDGLTALGRIMAECPTPVLMFSSLTSEGSDATIRALEVGAVDFLCKPSRAAATETPSFPAELRAKVHMAAALDTSRLSVPRHRAIAPPPPHGAPSSHVRLAVIGCSTGGPKALQALIPALPNDLSFPVLVVQHMPPGFTKSMAQRLDTESRIRVKEAEDGEPLSAGQVFIAPGDYHVTISASGCIRLNQEAPQCGVRPSIDVTMESAARFDGAHTVGVVLTGMGADGTRGAGLVKQAGGFVIAEAEETCIVYGMPRSVVCAGHADLVVPLNLIAGCLISYSG
ncbi:MAG: chemotaxis response regulator protein-glutamate methylesterase [Chloroflexi bacterium]|nr:chemotaxis response regulator protein-glutamate methylesterase [Chloroflexota bacterium]